MREIYIRYTIKCSEKKMEKKSCVKIFINNNTEKLVDSARATTPLNDRNLKSNKLQTMNPSPHNSTHVFHINYYESLS